MYTEHTYDDYLQDQELLATLASAFGLADDDSQAERCPMCGDRYPTADFDSYNGQRMCADCVNIERTNDAEKQLSPDFGELFRTPAAV